MFGLVKSLLFKILHFSSAACCESTELPNNLACLIVVIVIVIVLVNEPVRYSQDSTYDLDVQNVAGRRI